MNLALTLDDECKRVAKAEEISMEELVTDLSRLTVCSTRQFYNYRSGKWALPSTMIPALCKRFKSRALLHALEAECCDTVEEVPESFDLGRLVAQTVRETLAHYERFLAAFEDGVISQQELDELLASSDRVVTDVSHFKAIAMTDFERRQRFSPVARG